MKYRVKLRRATYEYVEVLVEEDDVETSGHAIDFVNDRAGDPDWDPQDHAIPGSEYADVDGTWDVVDVGHADGSPDPTWAPKTAAALRAAREAGIEVEHLTLPAARAEDMTGLPVVTRAEADMTGPPAGNRLVLPRGVSAEEWRKRAEEID